MRTILDSDQAGHRDDDELAMLYTHFKGRLLDDDDDELQEVDRRAYLFVMSYWRKP
jgi:hypothetical protein